MALKALMLKRSIEIKSGELGELRKKEPEFKAREAELEQSIDEAKTEEERSTVQEAIEAFDAEKEAFEKELEALEKTIEALEKELSDLESQTPPPAPKDDGNPNPNTERNDLHMHTLNIRSLPRGQRAFDALPLEQRQTIVNQPDVKQFLGELRAAAQTKRAVSGADLTVPVVFLDLISENVFRYSKLLKRVRVREIRGQGRQTIAGTVPEAIWTECCGAINELTFTFNQVTTDCYKVAGYVPVCNSLLDDNDINLASWIVEMLSESIGLAEDKAIIYGKGASSKMPQGFITRLAQTAAPADYPATAPAWTDLHTTNLISIPANLTGAAFWSALMMATGNAFSSYARGEQFWAMNSKTYALLKSKVITFTASGDIAANVFGALPIITGDIEILEFIPDGDIVGGFGDLYLWAQRSGIQIDMSEHVLFIQDNTVFRGKARADGLPVIPQAFVGININGAAVTTEVPFAADVANNAALEELTVGTDSLSPAFDPAVLSYTVTAGSAKAKVAATTAVAKAAVAIAYDGKNVRNGGEVTWLADGVAHPLTIKVTNGNATRVYTVNVTRTATTGG